MSKGTSMELWDAGRGWSHGQGVPALPTQETLAIWEGVSNYIVQQLMLNKGVRIIRLGSFSIVTKQVSVGKHSLVTVHRPVFCLSKNIVEPHGLTYDKTYAPGHKEMEPLKYSRIASELSVPRKTVEACIEETMRLFGRCLGSGKSVALVLKAMGMLVIQGKDVKMRYYRSFLRRLNGTEQLVEALLRMPEMRNSVLVGTETAFSQTCTGQVVVFPEYKLENKDRKPPGAPVKSKQEEERRDASPDQKGNLPAKCLRKRESCGESLRKSSLSRKSDPAPTLPTSIKQKDQRRKTEANAIQGSKLPAICGRSSRKAKKDRRKGSVPMPPVEQLVKRIERWPGEVEYHFRIMGEGTLVFPPI